jgi:hypothetical protein
LAAHESGRPPPDQAAQRLMDAVGLEGFSYYSAGDERAATAALERWPLLRGVFSALDGVRQIKPRILKTEMSD